MANKWAVQNGNWGDGSTWNDGVVPTADDDVYCNGHTITVQVNTEAFSHLISNYENNDIGVIQGGYISLFGILTSTCYTTVNRCLFLNNGMFNGDIIINDIVGSNYGIEYAYPTSNNVINGNITFSSESGYFIYDRSGILMVNGNIYVEGNSSWGSGFCYLKVNGNVSINFDNARDLGYLQEVNGILYLHNKGVGITETNAIIEKMIILETFSGPVILSNLGTNVTFKSGLENYVNAGVCYFTSVLPSDRDINFGGDFHLGNIIDISNQSYNSNFRSARVLDGGRLLYSQAYFTGANTRKGGFPFFSKFILENPSTFEIVYEGNGQPQFDIFPYQGNARLNYPNINDVSSGKKYGMQNEYEGRLALPQPSTVLKDVEYGDDKVGTLELIALSGATATADNISVVNLTEQQLQRVSNCATVSTVQKCFEDFKE